MNPYNIHLGANEPMTVLASTADRIESLCQAVAPELLAASPAPGKWSVHQTVAHLADCELVFCVRLRMILFEDNPPLAPFDQDRWAEGWLREREPFADTLLRFRVLRDATVRLLRAAPPADLSRTGVHAERGVQRAADYLALIAGHDCNHLAQIEAALQRA